MNREILSTRNKALNINLDSTVYGTFAEIGGGQEVARAFFQAGGASGTIAKSISAYDKTFSDNLYNNKKSGRYVSETRLTKMLDIEYGDLISTLSGKAGKDTRFFVFADTVETLNYQKSNKCNGWIGMKFQLNPGSPPNQISIHINLLENDSLLQQHTLGKFGVNLIYACYHFHERPNIFLQSLMDNLDNDRLEVNMVRMSGPELDFVDNRLLSVQLVNNNMTSATIFDTKGNVQQPSDMLYKKNLLAFRGSFRPITNAGYDMIKKSCTTFSTDEETSHENTIALCEITLSNLLQEGEFDERDFLDRVNLLNRLGQNVMISKFREYYKLVNYFSRFRIQKMRIVIGVPTLMNVWDRKYYKNLKGGILEAFGMLFPDNMKLYVYPSINTGTGEIIDSEGISLSTDLIHLKNYLKENGKIRDIYNADKRWLHLSSRKVLELMQKKDPVWEEMIPPPALQYIIENGIFGYKE